jgi:hypothetical protein
MKKALFFALSAGLMAGCATTPAAPMSSGERVQLARRVARGWYNHSTVLALKLIDEYGPPEEIESGRLTWYDKGPWARMAVWNQGDYYYSGVYGTDDLEQTVRYSVPSEKDKALASFSGELVVSGDHKELTVRGDDESRNYLTINLADDIVQGKRGPAGARLFYANVSELRESGKSSPYLERLLFIPDPSAAKPRF